MTLGRLAVLALIVVNFAAGTGKSDEESNALRTAIIPPNAQARLIELTASINVSNDSATDVHKYLFRLTTPANGLPYQRTRLLSEIQASTTKTHKNGVDQYLEMTLAIPGNKTVTQEVRFLVLLVPVEYFKVSKLPVDEKEKEAAAEFLGPTTLIEADAPEVKKAASSLFARATTDVTKAKAAYEYPSKVLKYRVQKPAGAVKALQTGIGDCTEYACLFAALSRCGGIPARRAAVFNLGTKDSLSVDEPNHDIAEAFLPSHGWVPVDPNVGGGKYDRPVGFANAGNSAIVLKREPSFVWSTFLPPDGFAKDAAKPTVKPTVKWQAKVVNSGTPKKLLDAFDAQGK